MLEKYNFYSLCVFLFSLFLCLSLLCLKTHSIILTHFSIDITTKKRTLTRNVPFVERDKCKKYIFMYIYNISLALHKYIEIFRLYIYIIISRIWTHNRNYSIHVSRIFLINFISFPLSLNAYVLFVIFSRFALIRSHNDKI